MTARCGCAHATFRDAVSCQVLCSEQSVEQIAAALGCGEAYLRKVSGRYNDDRRFPGEFIVPITEFTGRMVIVDWINRQLGQVTLELPGELATREDLLDYAARLVVDVGAYIDSARAALADNRVSGPEAIGIQEKAYALHRVVAQLEHHLVSASAAAPELARCL
jgi:hypothetical protein